MSNRNTAATRHDSRSALLRNTAGGRRAATSLIAALLVCGLTLLPAAALATPIDEFTDSTMVGPNAVSPGLILYSEVGLADVAGGIRTVELDVAAASGLADNVAFDIDTTGDGTAYYASGPMADADLSLLYDGPGLAADLNGVPLSFEVNFAAFDDGFQLGMDVTVIISDGVDFADLTIPIIGPSFNPFQLVFDLGSFSGIGLIDTTDLTSVEVLFEPMIGQDFALESIHATTAIPEPSAILLMLIGCVSFAGISARGISRRSFRRS